MPGDERRAATIGELGEEFVAWLCRQPFAPDYLFLRPKYTRGNLQRELCDVFILFESTAIIVQVKTPDPRAHVGWTDEQEAKWANKRVPEAVKQIGGALNTLVRGLIQEVRNKRRGAVPIHAAQLEHFYGLAVVHHPPLDRYGRPPVLSSDGQKCTVLTVTIDELSKMFEELTTIGDFIDYMRAREGFFAKNAMMGITELDLLATYKHDPEKFARDVQKYDGIMIGPGIWDDFSKKAQRAARDRANVPSRIVDAIIDLLHTESDELEHLRELKSQHGESISIGGNYIEIANELARLRRLDRRIVGQKLIEKSTKCIEEDRDRYLTVYPSEGADSAILFLISTASRLERCKTLQGLAFAARLALGVRRVTGIVTEPVTSPEHSIDACMVDIDLALDEGLVPDKMREDAKRFFQRSPDGDEYEFPQSLRD